MAAKRNGHISGVDVIRLLLRAAELNYRDPLRRGNVLALPGKGEAVIAGDLHGSLANFQRVVEIAALDRNRKRHIILQEVIHSSNVAHEGVRRSFEVLTELARLKALYPKRVHMIVANHDIAQACGHYIVKGGSILNMTFEAGLREAYGPLKPEVRESFSQLVYSMPAAARSRTGVFIAHSLPEPKGLESFDPTTLDAPVEPDHLMSSSVAGMVWGRDLSQEVADTFARLVKAKLFVIGHTPSDTGYKVANTRTLIIDSKDENGRVLILPLGKKFDSARALLPHLKPIMDFTPTIA